MTPHKKRPALHVGNSQWGVGIFGEPMQKNLKAPFPYFGGKSRVADLVWSRIGDVDNFIEPFCGSAAVLIARPHPPRIETLNDINCHVANFWRATSKDPEAVAGYCDWPVNEADLHSRHRYLVLSEDSKVFREKMGTDPDFFDAKVAGWWCWGMCCWIGAGWCGDFGMNAAGEPMDKRPRMHGGDGGDPPGVHSGMLAQTRHRMPTAQQCETGGRGVHGVGRVKGLREKQPHADMNRGINGEASLPETRPHISGPGQGTKWGHGVHAKGGIDPETMQEVQVPDGRPQLADAYDIGRGVNSNGKLGTCAERTAWLVEWFQRLRDRLRTTRVCCGKWIRVCDSPSVTTRLGVTGIFLDPPYGKEADRSSGLYANDDEEVAVDVRAYCLERGGNPKMRICLAGYAGEGHEALEAAGWTVVEWEAQGGYGNRSEKGKANAKRERLWFSPHCKEDKGLFDA